MPTSKDTKQWPKVLRSKPTEPFVSPADFEKVLRIARLWVEQTKPGSSWRGTIEKLLVPDENDASALFLRGKESAEFHRGYLKESYTAEPGDAIRDEDELNPGNHKVIFKSLDGTQNVYRNLRADYQSPPGADPMSGVGAAEESSESDRLINAWKILRDPAAPAFSRISAVGELRNAGSEAAVVNYLVEELGRVDQLEPDWRDAIIYAAEDCHFPADSREALGGILWGIASSLRRKTDVAEKIVWSALRRGSSLLPPSRVEGLVGFLEPFSVIDTRSVALQCVVRMLETWPPASPPPTLADRAHRFAVLFLDRDVFYSGESSVIARNAVAALAAMGDARLDGALAAMRALGRPWLVRRVGAELERILRGWTDREVSPDHPAFSNLKRALESLA
jgi:hypothetical protein